MRRPERYGLLAEYEGSHALVAAARAVREAGYRRIDAYSPFPVEGLAAALALGRTWMPQIVLGGGLAGCALGWLLQGWVSAVDYPVNVGGRPPFSWPSFVPIAFETTILLAVLAAVLGLFALSGLPKPYHPLFHVPAFDRATRDRFFLAVKADDPRFDLEGTRRTLESTGAVAVHEVPP